MSARTVDVPTAADMRALGESVGRACEPGDVIVLAGGLGAGKTTFTQGLARGLGIDEPVTSPTFVIARVHANPGDRPHLVHVDAYRLGSSVELDDLDLDADLASSVVVVEWGTGVADHLSDRRLDVMIARSDDESDDVRVVRLVPHDASWSARVDRVAVGGAS